MYTNLAFSVVIYSKNAQFWFKVWYFSDFFGYQSVFAHRHLQNHDNVFFLERSNANCFYLEVSKRSYVLGYKTWFERNDS